MNRNLYISFVTAFLILIQISCSLNNKPSITSYPSIIYFDSLLVLSTHVYTVHGEKDTVTEQLVQLQPTKINDSIRFITRHTAELYWHSRKAKNKAQKVNIDKLHVIVSSNNFQTTMINPPELYVVPDTRVPVRNAQIIEDRGKVTQAFMKVYHKSKKKFYLEQYSVKLMTPNNGTPVKYNGYTISGLNKVDVQMLRDNLEADEHLVVIKYCEVFRKK